MHEYSLVQALLQRVGEEARARGAVAVHRVAVRIGPLAGVERRLFATAFGLCRADGLCDGAELVIAGDDVAWTCAVCGAGLTATGAPVCPTCGLPARLTGGDELMLDRIDLEVPADV